MLVDGGIEGQRWGSNMLGHKNSSGLELLFLAKKCIMS